MAMHSPPAGALSPFRPLLERRAGSIPMNKPTLSSRLAGTAALAAILAVLSPGLSSSAHAQGCVAVRQMGDVACTIGAFEHAHVERWSVNVNYEWFESHRHFVGREEQVHRAEQAVALVNDSPYGLTAAIHTASVHRAMGFAEGVATGVVVVNAGTHGSEPHMGFGGVKQSGTGWKEAGLEALDVYSETQYVNLVVDPGLV